MLCRKDYLVKTGIAGFSIVFAACGVLGPLTDSDSSDNDSSAGVATEQVTASEGGSLEAETGSEISGASVSIAPGALSVDTEVSVTTGEQLLDASVQSDLNLGEDFAPQVAGPTVVVDAADLVDATQPMQLAIPFTDTGSGSPLVAEVHAVLYKVKKASENGQLYVGLITDVVKEGSTLKFDTLHFGAYQAIKLAKAVEAPVEKKTFEPIAKKAEGTEISGSWAVDCYDNSKTRSDGTIENRSEVQVLKFYGNKFSARGMEYESTDCTGDLTHSYMVVGTYTLGEAYDKIADTKKMDINFGKFYMAVWHEFLVEEYNKRKTCGYSDWAIGELKEANETCDFGGGDDEGGNDSGGEGSGGEGSGGEGSGGEGSGGTDGAQGSGENSSDCESNDGPPGDGEVLYQVYKLTGDALILGEEDEKDGSCTTYGDTDANRPIKLGEEGTDNYYKRQ